VKISPNALARGVVRQNIERNWIAESITDVPHRSADGA